MGSVPDLIDDDDSLIELPPITPSGSVVAHPQSHYSPVLAETLYIPPPQARVTTTVAAMVADEKPRHRKAPSRKPKRHLLRTFMTLVVLFGLLAGGAFAAKKYLLQEPKWTAELKPLADEVSAARDLPFKLSVEVIELPVADYAQRLVASAIDSPETDAPVWRALGLVNGELDLDLVGRQAVNDLPAFSEPATKTILVTDDLKSYEHLYRFALRRALTTALLDQQFDWSSRCRPRRRQCRWRSRNDRRRRVGRGELTCCRRLGRSAFARAVLVRPGECDRLGAVAVRGDNHRSPRCRHAPDDRCDGR